MKKIEFETPQFRSLIHQHGIEWIKKINRDLNVDLSNLSQVFECYINKCAVIITFSCSTYIMDLPMYEVFPDEDFCIYTNYPFNQMVFFIQSILYQKEYDTCNPKLSCTFLWLIQYYNEVEYYKNQVFILNTLQFFINSDEFQSMSKCNFTHRISMCNK